MPSLRVILYESKTSRHPKEIQLVATLEDALIKLGYPNYAATPDDTPYACAYCATPLWYNKSRRIPDQFCTRCYSVFKEFKTQEVVTTTDGREKVRDRYPQWLEYLIRVENNRRNVLYKRRKRGEEYSFVSFEECYDHPEIIHEARP